MWKSRKLTPQILIKHLFQPLTLMLFLSSSLLLCFSIRTANLSQLEGKYLLESDAYRFLRQANMIVSEGHLPQVDPMRWQPAGRDLSTHLNLFSYALAYSYRLLRLIHPVLSLYQVAVYAPVVCYSLGLLLLYLIWRRIFDPSVAILAVNFSAIFPSLNLHRSTAGFADRDAFCLLLWLGMLLLYLKAVDDGQVKGYIYAAISGFTAGMLALAWEGCGLATAMIAIWTCLRILRERFEPRDVRVYSVWYVCFISIALSLTHAYRNVLLPYAFLAIVVPTVALFCGLAFWGLHCKTSWLRKAGWALSTKVKKWWAAEKWAMPTLPKGIVSCLLGGFMGVLLLLVLASLQSANIGEMFRLLQDNFMSPLGRSRLMRTVMELKDLSGPQWVGRYSIVALAAMASSVVLVYQFFSSERAHFRLAMVGFELVLCGTLLSLFVPVQNVSNAIYEGAILSGSIAIFAAYTLPHERKEAIPSHHEKVLLVLIWLLIILFSTRGAERYGFFLDPLLAVLSSFLIIKSLRFFTKRQTPSVIEFCTIGVLVVSELYAGFRLSLGFNLTGWSVLGLSVMGVFFGGILIFHLISHRISHRQSFAYLAIILILVLFISSDTFHKGFVSGSAEVVSQVIHPPYPKLQDSFAEIANHTDEKSLLAAWWDYGSMLNWFARRATVVDEDHFIPYWIFLIARHVFSAFSPEEALAFLRTHQATHLLITTNDLLRLSAITYTGADTIFDRFASIHFLTPLNSQYAETSVERTDFIPHDFLATDVLELDDEKYLPGHWYIQGVSITYDTANNSWKAMIHGAAGEKHFSKPPLEFRLGNTTVNHQKDGVPGSVVVFPNRDGKNLQAFYVSEKAKRLLAVRLYLLMENLPGFSLVYDTNSVARCDRDGLRLWKINYPEGMPPEERYLARDFPPTEKKLKASWQRGDFMGFQKF